jgi:23S rRNA U2552 (ribose-2'-O)-methylase RlmE/FtsJ
MLAGRPVDVVVSDMAPNLSGIESSDAARIAHLVELAVDFRRRHLRPEGALVVQGFHGSGYSQLVTLFKQHLPGGQAHQAQGLARQVGGNLSGRRGSEAR